MASMALMEYRCAFSGQSPSRADLLSWDLFVYAKDLLIEAMAGPIGQCELAHISLAQLRAL
jgi:hypothetical protein